MPAYFKPFRRKLGVVVLLVTLVALIEWVRSFYVMDVIMFVANKANHSLISETHGLTWLSTGLTDEEYEEAIEESDLPFAVVFDFPQKFDLRGWTLKSSWLGFEKYERKYRKETIDLVQIIPYWSVVTPLTLLSVWLMLSKPRFVKSKSVPESNS